MHVASDAKTPNAIGDLPTAIVMVLPLKSVLSTVMTRSYASAARAAARQVPGSATSGLEGHSSFQTFAPAANGEERPKADPSKVCGGDYEEEEAATRDPLARPSYLWNASPELQNRTQCSGGRTWSWKA